MKIGIIQCDDVDVELRTEFGNYPAMFEAKLGGVAPDFKFVTYRATDGVLPQTIDECDGYLVTGSRFGANDDLPWIDQLEIFVRNLAEAERKFVGICFGHQVLAKAFGGEIAVSERGWAVGINSNRIDVEKSWMDPAVSSIKLVVSHQDQVSRLPPGMEVIASSSFCPYYMLQYGAHMMSVQGHPEFSKAYSKVLMDKRADLIPAPCIRAGQASLADEADDLLMMRWIANFFKDSSAGDL
jgi:GMP synthase-like glutamine amidotransferase